MVILINHNFINIRVFVIITLTVNHYTREAGVRTLERKIGAVNRAVAVKVAENMTKKSKLEESKSADVNKSANETNAMTLPPVLPIIIDEAALEDILGVCFNYYCY